MVWAQRWSFFTSLFVCAFTLPLPSADQENRGQWVPYLPMWDEFDNGTLDSEKWYDHNPGWNGRQPGLFKPENVEVNAGELYLWARHEVLNSTWRKNGFNNYTTAAVRSKATVAYGYFEIRARAGSSKISSSFWFHSNNGTMWSEIDVFETTGMGDVYSRSWPSHTHIFQMNGLNISTEVPARCNCTTTGQGDQAVCSDGHTFTASEDVSANYHIVGLNWTSSSISVSIDGVTRWSVPNHCLSQPLGLDFDRETMPDWFGLPDVASLPDRPFSIDYIRAWKSGIY